MQEKTSLILAPYTNIHLVAKGGMGEVYRALDPRFGRYIAIKKIRDDLLSHKNIMRRFKREALITAKLNHPSIIPILDIHFDSDPLYYTMPYLEGSTLKAVMRLWMKNKEQFSISKVLQWFYHVCQGVAHAHAHGVIHRDLKPENIMIGVHDQVVILDWGLAVSVFEPQEPMPEVVDLRQKTLLGKIVGTLAYLAPERLVQPATIGSDIFSLGVMLYFLVTSKLPFRRESIEDWKTKVDGEKYEDPRLRVPDREIPAGIVKIIDRCLQRDARNRYPNVEALLADLTSFFEGISEWQPKDTLQLNHEHHWQLQEHIYVAPSFKGLGLKTSPIWSSLSVSESSYPGNVRVEIDFQADSEAEGIGILVNVPDMVSRKAPLDGFCFWAGLCKQAQSYSVMLRNGRIVLMSPENGIYIGKKHTLV